MGRRYGDFVRLHKRLRTELPGKALPYLPRKNKSSTTSHLLGVGGDDDASSISSVSTTATTPTLAPDDSHSLRSLVSAGHRRSLSRDRPSRASGELIRERVVLYREDQRVSLRAFLRTLLQNEQVAESNAMRQFLSADPIRLNEEEMGDIQRRKEMDQKRIEEQRRFYEIARQRAKELDVYMERFRRDLVESSMLIPNAMLSKTKGRVDGLTKLFKEIKEKQRIADLSLEYQKFAEWLRIESVR